VIEVRDIGSGVSISVGGLKPIGTILIKPFQRAGIRMEITVHRPDRGADTRRSEPWLLASGFRMV